MTPEDESAAVRRQFTAIMDRSQVATDRTICQLDEKLTARATRVEHVHTFKLPQVSTKAMVLVATVVTAFLVFLALLVR